VSLPLKGICILRRGSVNRIRRITPDEAREMICHQCHMPTEIPFQERMQALANELMQIVPLWEMECTKEPEAALLSYCAMSGNDIYENK
jgi:hypothetical protein